MKSIGSYKKFMFPVLVTHSDVSAGIIEPKCVNKISYSAKKEQIQEFTHLV